MKTSFILCEASDTHEVTHIICVTYPAIFDYPGFNLISGCNDPKVRESALMWFENGCKQEVKKVRSQPPGFQEAMLKVRENREQVNIAELAEAVGISEKFLTLCIDYEKWKGTAVRMPMAFRQRFIEVVGNLELLNVL